jgi:hypothetical protein
MTINFEDYIIGHWTNKSQAQSNPHHFVSVEIVWKRHEEGYQSMNYKRADGPDYFYRKKNHKFVQISDTEVLVENYHLDWTRHEDCDILFTFDGKAWHGQLACPGKCHGYRGDRVVSEVHAYGDKLHTMDQGYDIETGEFVWGSKQLYKFTRMGE